MHGMSVIHGMLPQTCRLYTTCICSRGAAVKEKPLEQITNAWWTNIQIWSQSYVLLRPTQTSYRCRSWCTYYNLITSVNWFGYAISLTYIEPVEQGLLGRGSIFRLVLQTKPNADLVVKDECPYQTKNQLQVTTNYVSTTWRSMCVYSVCVRKRE